MTAFSEWDTDLHHEDGSHRQPPPVFTYEQMARRRFQARMAAHMQVHRDQEARRDPDPALGVKCPTCLRRPGEMCTAIEGFYSGALMGTPHSARSALVATPDRRDDGTYACCGGYGEHFAHCPQATWEKADR